MVCAGSFPEDTYKFFLMAFTITFTTDFHITNSTKTDEDTSKFFLMAFAITFMTNFHITNSTKMMTEMIVTVTGWLILNL